MRAILRSRRLRYLREMRRLEEMLLPDDPDYGAIRGLRLEAIEKVYLSREYRSGPAASAGFLPPISAF